MIHFQIGAGYRGYNEQLPEPTPTPSNIFEESMNATGSMPFLDTSNGNGNGTAGVDVSEDAATLQPPSREMMSNVFRTAALRLSDFLTGSRRIVKRTDAVSPSVVGGSAEAQPTNQPVTDLGASITIAMPSGTTDEPAGKWTVNDWRLWA